MEYAMSQADRASNKRFTTHDYAKVAAEIATRIIKKAFDAGCNTDFETLTIEGVTAQEEKEKWLLENGVTEK